MGLDGLWGFFQYKPFCDSIVQPKLLHILQDPLQLSRHNTIQSLQNVTQIKIKMKFIERKTSESNSAAWKPFRGPCARIFTQVSAESNNASKAAELWRGVSPEVWQNAGSFTSKLDSYPWAAALGSPTELSSWWYKQGQLQSQIPQRYKTNPTALK